MEAWQERVIQEAKELDERIGKLRLYIAGGLRSGFGALHVNEQRRLTSQLGYMEGYSNILHERIDEFEGIYTNG